MMPSSSTAVCRSLPKGFSTTMRVQPATGSPLACSASEAPRRESPEAPSCRTITGNWSRRRGQVEQPVAARSRRCGRARRARPPAARSPRGRRTRPARSAASRRMRLARASRRPACRSGRRPPGAAARGTTRRPAACGRSRRWSVPQGSTPWHAGRRAPGMSLRCVRSPVAPKMTRLHGSGVSRAAEGRGRRLRGVRAHAPFSLTAWPPNSLRSAASTLPLNVSSWRERKRMKRLAAITGSGTLCAIACSTVQRPSPVSST